MTEIEVLVLVLLIPLALVNWHIVSARGNQHGVISAVVADESLLNSRPGIIVSINLPVPLVLPLFSLALEPIHGHE